MIKIETKRMVGFSDLQIVSGKITAQNSHNDVDILDLKPATGKESSFQFYLKNTEKCVCHVGFTWQRGRTEVSYGTESGFERNGYVQEALRAVIEWTITNTKEDQVWGLPNGPVSQHILEKTGFICQGQVEKSTDQSWFVYNVEDA